MKIAIGINGAAGRMGQRLVALSQEDPELKLVAALEFPQHPSLGKDAGEIAGLGILGLPVQAQPGLGTTINALIDFSTPEGTMTILPLCLNRKIPLVVATTGHTSEQRQEIASAAHQIPVLHAPNMSLAVNVLFELTRVASQLLAGKGFDVEIIERHHRYKKDSPSGTALQFAKIVQQVQGQKEFRHGREGLVGERPESEIGIHAVRVGDNVGEHTVVFSTLGETMELVHKGHTRDSYARGALLAAKFLASKGPGMYSMNDVLGIAP
ncbi:MAG: 4-hydroxy-tetrahydrodipicolinate reductase [Gemmataceae bacterium]|nr:4-hydroxy-tetrahydrodipicolinate reductase [Gemmataceae bacterium]